MSQLRSRDALRREAESDQRAAEARAELESRIEEAMDRWQGQALKAHWLEWEQQKALASCAERVYSRYGALLL